ncbi:uncharacterized protein LOC111351218 [Spodoptera litura]|uniref:Uncharacterized protein LOC111351218 n=1 Tax=Spodoptera litura TaxID=69820 RepID=A0A9J7IKR4_SPOLT|nr:uncharacterized protein LOC111351218 [Spodoptera litura]
MWQVYSDALERTPPPVRSGQYLRNLSTSFGLGPKELPSELRRKAEAEAIMVHGSTCLCDVEITGRPSRIQFNVAALSDDEKKKLLPSELREYEEWKKCKCDAELKADADEAHVDDAMTDYTEATDYTAFTYTDEVGENDEEEEEN